MLHADYKKFIVQKGIKQDKKEQKEIKTAFFSWLLILLPKVKDSFLYALPGISYASEILHMYVEGHARVSVGSWIKEKKKVSCR